MVRTLPLALLVVLGSPLATFAQPPNLPAQPVPIAPPPGPAPGFGPGPGAIQPIIVPRTELPPNNNPLVPATPVFVAPTQGTGAILNDPRPPPSSGFFGTLEISLLFPELHGFLSGTVNQGSFVDTFTIDGARLDGTGSPRVELGYRLPDGLGAVAMSYRSIVSTGGENIENFDFLGPGYLSSRLNVNVVDVDYGSPAFNVLPFWDVAFRAGLRGAAVYFDHQAIGQFAQLHASNNFLGIGPHFGVELGRQLDLIPGLAITTKLDGAILFGSLTQSFDETFHYPDQDYGSASRSSSTQTVPVLTFNLGLSYTPPFGPNWARFGFGYQFEYWWDVGTQGGSRGDLSSNGIYFRGEFNF